MQRFLQRLRRLMERPAEPRRSLVKRRPATLEQRYEVVGYEPLADEVFLRLKRRLYQELDRRERGRGPVVFREAGKIADGRPYFYLKPAGEKGWLFERYGSGWIVSGAEKIAGRDLFVRDRELVDRVDLYMAGDTAALPRVQSPALGGDLLALAVYEQKLLQRLGLS